MKPDLYAISIIGGADGPTAVFVAGQFPWLTVGVIAAVVVAVVLIALYVKHK